MNGGILDLRPTSQQGKRWNLSDRKDQREIMWLIRKKRPKLVIGYGRCILFCTVLYRDPIRRGPWFLHDLSGDGSQLSPIHDTLGVQANCQTGGRIQTSRGSGFRDLRRSSATSWRRRAHICHNAHGLCEQARPFDLTPQMLKRRSRRSEGGQIAQELNSTREGKYWDDVKGGKAREEEMQYVKKTRCMKRSP